LRHANYDREVNGKPPWHQRLGGFLDWVNLTASRAKAAVLVVSIISGVGAFLLWVTGRWGPAALVLVAVAVAIAAFVTVNRIRSRPPPPVTALPIDPMPRPLRGGYMLQAETTSDLQLRLTLRSANDRTKPGAWACTVTSPAFQGQAWSFEGDPVIETAGSIQLDFPRQFKTPVQIPLPKGTYIARWFNAMYDRQMNPVDMHEIALVELDIDEAGRLVELRWPPSASGPRVQK
jgi:hypothetical protein